MSEEFASYGFLGVTDLIWGFRPHLSASAAVRQKIRASGQKRTAPVGRDMIA